jgi:small subunit ribosomal protein S5
MEQDIKRIKDQEQQEALEEEVVEVKTGKIDIEVPAETEAEASAEEPVAAEASSSKEAPSFKGGRFGKRRGGREGGARKGRGGGEHKAAGEEFEQKILDLARVTRVMAGGKRMRFRACVVIGDRKGKVGLALAKGKDVTIAISKAVAKARKNMITVPFVNETIPFTVEEKFKAAKVLLKPAKKGKGIIAGGALRIVLELAGVPNVVAKILGTNNQVTNAKAIMAALKRLGSFSARKPRKNLIVSAEAKSPEKK